MYIAPNASAGPSVSPQTRSIAPKKPLDMSKWIIPDWYDVEAEKRLAEELHIPVDPDDDEYFEEVCEGDGGEGLGALS